MPLGLWEQTKPSFTGSDLHKMEPSPLSGEEGERGLVRINLTGTQLVEYMDDLDRDAHGYGIAEQPADDRAAASRVYTAISEVVDQIGVRQSPEDPAPEVLIDDTIIDEA